MDHDVIIIGSGAGGGTLAYRLARDGLQVLVLERGAFLPREKENWDTSTVFQTNRYHNSETWLDGSGKELHPGMCYAVGGNTKLYGAALFRLRERDFEAYQHHDGLSPSWPLSYADFEPYYSQAEDLYQVHGRQGIDPTEPPRSRDYAHPPVSHEPRIAETSDLLAARGLHPYPTPLGIHLNEAQRYLSECIRCNTCDGFPCLVHAKSDAEITALLPSLARDNFTLIPDARVERLRLDPSGCRVREVEAIVQGQLRSFRGEIVVVACGAINSAALLLRSACEGHPDGLANGSGLVGRNLMKHVLGSVIGVTKRPNPTAFQKTLSINDFYWGEEGFPFPMGQIQTLGKVNKEMLSGDPMTYAPLTPEEVASHSIDWWLTTEDLPDSNNRVRVQTDRIVMEYRENNGAAYTRLEQRWTEILRSMECAEAIHTHPTYFLPGSKQYFTGKLPVEGVGHQVGTCRFGEDPRTSVLDLHCRTHELENLYVVDGSFFPSSGAVNPTLTIIANALRVGEHLSSLL
jgi:choline dehydrogenase-like flavoprotein